MPGRGTTDWTGEVIVFLRDTALFGAQEGARTLPPLRPTTLAFTPIKYAESVLEFFSSNAPEIWNGIATAVGNLPNGKTNAKIARAIADLHDGSGPLQIAAWQKLLGQRLVRTTSAERDLMQEFNDGAVRAVHALVLGNIASVPNDDGNGEHLPAALNSEFWSGVIKMAHAAQAAEVVIDTPSVAGEIIQAIKDLPETLEDASDGIARVGAKFVKVTAGIAGSALGEFIGELGILPIAIGAAAIYVGVNVL